MDVAARMVSTQTLLFLYALTGVLTRRIGILRPETRKAFVSLLVYITLPCMILSAFNKPLSAEEMRAAAAMLVLSAAGLLVSWLMAVLLFRRRPPAERSVLYFATLFSNAGNAGLPVTSLVYGATGVFYASIYLIPIRVAMFTVGIALYTGKPKREGVWAGIKRLLKNPSVAVVLVGLFLMLTRLTLPSVLGDAVRNIGDMTSPLAMMIIGASLADMKPREMFSAQAFLVSLVRLVVLPALVWALFRLLGAEQLPTAVAVTLVAMPVATNTAILAEQYGADYLFASKCVFISTILSLGTVPIITLLMELAKHR